MGCSPHMQIERRRGQCYKTGAANLHQCMDGHAGSHTMVRGTTVKLTEAFALRESLQLSIIFARAME